ncbi:fatty acid desaturase [Paraburkholderia sp. BCC1876]|uniref:fatty acid desaturase n=1 Tax=Paraburkholderia sp. BCC1876 TaxID=2676303 RepID=UPI00158FF61D|nr:fatty acid desaturase [Paraburkholderia sp. BCC1876]
MFETGTRESMHGLPRFTQPVLTWITGKPLHASDIRLILPRWLDVTATPLAGVFIVFALARLSRFDTPLAWFGIVVLWLVLVGLFRKIQVTHLHHAIHNRLFDSAVLNKAYAQFVPALLFVQNGIEYKKEHLEHHNANFFTTHADADAAFLAKLGFLPGRTKGELWMNLWMTVLSPVFHLLFARARLRSTFLRAKPTAIAVAMVAACGYSTLFALLGWRAFLIAVALPLFPIYHVSALLQFLTEHAWNVAAGPVRDWKHYAERCWARFCGERFPFRRSGIMGSVLFVRDVLIWTLKMTFLHLPIRVSCLVSDLPVHDWHHLAHLAGQNARDWQRGLYLRQAAIADGDRAGFAERELWGMPRMIDHQFGWLESIVCKYEYQAGQSQATET